MFQARWLDYNQATPIIIDGIMYTTQGNDVVALDAATGKIFWIYPYATGSDVRLCCGRITRGLAILDDTLFLAAADAHLSCHRREDRTPRAEPASWLRELRILDDTQRPWSSKTR